MQTRRDFIKRAASSAAAAAAPATVATLLARVAELEAEVAREKDRFDMAEGRRGVNGVRCIPGFTITQTEIIRILYARGRAEHDNYSCLYRHISNIRKRARKLGIMPPSKADHLRAPHQFVIRTDAGLGYELDPPSRAVLQGLLYPAGGVKGATKAKTRRAG